MVFFSKVRYFFPVIAIWLIKVERFSIFADPVHKVHCSSQEMVVEMIKPLDVTHVYLEHLKHYPGTYYVFFIVLSLVSL